MILTMEHGLIREKSMSYNIKNKNIALVCLSVAIMMTLSNSLHAEEAVPPMDLDDIVAVDEGSKTQNEEVSTESEAKETNDEEQNDTVSENTDSQNVDEMFADLEDEVSSETPQNIDKTNSETPSEATTTENVSEDTTTEESMVVEAPKSPFESFGNSILARVDNDLFNQMSSIEKQTTLLNLELKREEVRNKVEALKAQREKAIAEEAAKKIEEEQKIKQLELERELKLMEAQEKIKAKEIELEKVRQAKVLNDYMNEMLIVNQKWIEKNAELQNKVSELQQERLSLIKQFENKMSDVKKDSSNTVTLAETAKESFNRTVTSYRAQINNLRKSLSDSENAVEQLKSGNSANPFADLAAAGIDENAIDMSNEYAIMDITGTGNEIIAKIVAKDGTTFIVHKGSMLKGGEVVTAITDNFVAFDKNGMKSYLYTGGTVREYEPAVSFNESEKLDKESSAQDNLENNLRNVSNVRGIKTNTDTTPKQQTTTQNKTTTTKVNTSNRSKSTSRQISSSNRNSSGRNTSRRNTSNASSGKSSKRSSGGGVVSAASGMFVK